MLQDVIGEHEAFGSGDSAEFADLAERQAFKGIAVVIAERLSDELEIGARILDSGELSDRLAGRVHNLIAGRLGDAIVDVGLWVMGLA